MGTSSQNHKTRRSVRPIFCAALVVACGVSFVVWASRPHARQETLSVARVVPSASVQFRTPFHSTIAPGSAVRAPASLSVEAARFCREAFALSDEASSDAALSYDSNAVLSRLSDRLEEGDRQVLSPDGPVFGRPHLDALKGEFARMVMGLRLAHLLDEQPGVELGENLSRAERIFSELSSADPSNAAYVLYHFAVAMKMHRGDRALAQIAEGLERARVFNSQFLDFFHRLQQAALESGDASIYLRASHLLTVSVVPNYSFVDAVRARLGEIDSEAVRRLGDLMARGGLDAQASYLHYGYSPTEYALGRTLSGRALPDVHELENGKWGANHSLYDILMADRKCDDRDLANWKAYMKTEREK